MGLSVAVPAALAGRADTAVRAAVAQAAPPAELLVTAPYVIGASDPTVGAADTTVGVDDVARRITDALPDSLRRVLGPPGRRRHQHRPRVQHPRAADRRRPVDELPVVGR